MRISLSKIKHIIARSIAYVFLCCKVLYIRTIRFTTKHNIFLVNIPSHGNLGDHLIFEAEKAFFREQLPKYKIHYITTADLYYSLDIIIKAIGKKDIVCITGGGFLGTLWPEEELRIRRIVQKLSNNKIIFFPETVFYQKNNKTEDLLKEAETIYSSHNNLYISARDTSSYVLLKDIILRKHSNRVFLIPDVALYLNYKLDLRRDKILFCLRKDKEKASSTDEIIKVLYERLKTNNITYTDTVVPYSINTRVSSKEVHKKLIEFASAKLVITDRLHGMIYSVITNTPVIVLNNISNKVEQVYELWLKDVQFVKFVNDPEEVDMAIDELSMIGHHQFSNDKLKEKITKLKDIICD